MSRTPAWTGYLYGSPHHCQRDACHGRAVYPHFEDRPWLWTGCLSAALFLLLQLTHKHTHTHAHHYYLTIGEVCDLQDGLFCLTLPTPKATLQFFQSNNKKKKIIIQIKEERRNIHVGNTDYPIIIYIFYPNLNVSCAACVKLNKFMAKIYDMVHKSSSGPL